jgi:hypothetical protein
MTMSLTCCSRGALILLLTATAAWAQATAQMNGTVRDESGAVLPGVTVTATQVDTGATRTAVTDETGAYLLPNLPTGPYKLQVALSGFRSYEQTGIVLQVGATPVINAVLAVGNVEETVSVEGAAPLVDVRSAGISSVVENERILELPLQGRQVTDLLVLAGAAVQTGVPPRGVPGGVNIAVAGGLPFGVSYTLDGATHNNPQSNTNLPLPFPDALQEFRVATSGLSAENGMHSGASVSAVTKSGTNRFSGHRLRVRPRSSFQRDQSVRAGPSRRHARRRWAQAQSIRRNTRRPDRARQAVFLRRVSGHGQAAAAGDQHHVHPHGADARGDFTAITSPACNGGRQINLTRPFVGNSIDPARFSPAALNIIKKLPATTNPCGEITVREHGRPGRASAGRQGRLPVEARDSRSSAGISGRGLRFLRGTAAAPTIF